MNALGGTAPYEFSTDGLTYQPSPIFEGLARGPDPVDFHPSMKISVDSGLEATDFLSPMLDEAFDLYVPRHYTGS